MADVKGPPGQARKDRAKATRRRIVDCAYRLFCDKGYASTTMESIADASGVAVQTVYYVFRTKAQLLQEVIEVAAAGQHDPLPVMQRPWMQEALTTSDAARSLALNVEHGVDIYARVAPLGPAVQMAASLDPDIETYWRAIADGRRRGMSQLVAHLAASGGEPIAVDSEGVARTFSGTIAVSGHTGFAEQTFEATAIDNGNDPQNPDVFLIEFSNGYTVGGPITSGYIEITTRCQAPPGA